MCVQWWKKKLGTNYKLLYVKYYGVLCNLFQPSEMNFKIFIISNIGQKFAFLLYLFKKKTGKKDCDSVQFLQNKDCNFKNNLYF